MTPGECWRPLCRFAAGQIQHFGAEFWIIHSLCKGRKTLSGEASQPGDCSDAAGLGVPVSLRPRAALPFCSAGSPALWWRC